MRRATRAASTDASVKAGRIRCDRPPEAVGLSEVALEDAPDVADVLDGQGLVEPVPLLENSTDGRVARALPGRRADRIARQDEQADEEDQARPEEDEDHLQQPPGDVLTHEVTIYLTSD